MYLDSESCVIGNRALGGLSVSYPKKDWLAPQSFFGYYTDYKIVLPSALSVGVIPKEVLAGPPTNPSFGKTFFHSFLEQKEYQST